MLALTRLPAPSFATDCLVTFVERRPVDFGEALRQHAGYRRALEAAGCRVVLLPALADLADSVFVEDAALALPEAVVLCRPGAPERRPEVEALEKDLAVRAAAAGPGGPGGPGGSGLDGPDLFGGRPTLRVEAPATLDGGDVVRLGRRLVVGRSTRTDDAGVSALAGLVEPLGYSVVDVEVDDVLHLESVATALDDDTVLVDPGRVDPAAFAPATPIEIHPDEPLGANVARAGRALVASASAPGTAGRLRGAGYEVLVVPLSEFEKAEGAATCLSVRLP